ncbi:MAG TPA: PorP/SprF family type IX secretion system membrane protein [Saprospiraceae bacterium]|nr:PorP/SprF family type IX secretion system membrane protein [Saprospiraceae bacterium]
MLCRYLHIVLLISIASLSVKAQQPGQYSFYFLDKFIFNPAYAGLDNSFSGLILARGQWTGLNGSPVQENISFHFPLHNIGGGVGLNIENEKLGLEQNLNASVSYSQHIRVSQSSVLSLGLRGSLLNKKFDGSSATTPDGEYPAGGNPDHKDDYVPTTAVSSSTYNASAGVYFKARQFEAGIGVESFLPTKWKFVSNTDVIIAVKSYYFINFAYTFEINDGFDLSINGLVKSNTTQWQTDISTFMNLYDNFFVGIAFRGYNSSTFDAISWLGGYRLSEGLKMVLAYDQGLSSLKHVNNGTFEFGLQYMWGEKYLKGKLPVIIFNPRY